jgi:hypothetical protein
MSIRRNQHPRTSAETHGLQIRANGATGARHTCPCLSQKFVEIRKNPQDLNSCDSCNSWIIKKIRRILNSFHSFNSVTKLIR